MNERNDFFKELEELGEDEVRNRLAVGIWRRNRKVGLAEEWLRAREQEREDVRNNEQINIARSAKNAAWIAAIAAIIAAIAAIIALAY